MKTIIFAITLSCLLLVLAGCRKEKLTTAQCNDLKSGLVAEDESMVRESLGNLLRRYSKNNLEQLTGTVSDNCDISASFDCYSCIKTNPEQTEVNFSFTHQGATVTKVVDISFDTDNKMVIVNVH